MCVQKARTASPTKRTDKVRPILGRRLRELDAAP
jgi:hypothetical protein